MVQRVSGGSFLRATCFGKCAVVKLKASGEKSAQRRTEHCAAETDPGEGPHREKLGNTSAEEVGCHRAPQHRDDANGTGSPHRVPHRVPAQRSRTGPAQGPCTGYPHRVSRIPAHREKHPAHSLFFNTSK